MRGALLAAALAVGPALGAEVPQPEGYRMDRYRAPVPAALAGARTVGVEDAHRLWRSGEAVFVDVLPQAPEPDLPEGTIWRAPTRHSIPGAVWLPNVGYGALAPVNHAYFRAGLAEATGGDPNRPVLFFCLDACWMSWNAAKRALEYGYTAVYWFPEGTDGWTIMDLPTEPILPVPEGR